MFGLLRGFEFGAWLDREREARKPACNGSMKMKPCSRCGLCCLRCPGLMSRKDVEAMAKHLKITEKELVAKYLTLHDNSKDKKWRPMPVRKGGQHEAGRCLSNLGSWKMSPCIFLKESKKEGCTCLVYAAIVQHGWVELKDGKVCDPTRWEFEGKEPYVYIGKNDFYDVGGNVYRFQNMTPPPRHDSAKEQLKVSFGQQTGNYIRSILGRMDESQTYTIDEMFWVANLPLKVLGEKARNVYLALSKAELGGLIPIDNYRVAVEG